MVHLRPCACPPQQMLRVHRSLWMRMLFPARVLYECSSCGGRFLASVADQADLGLRAQAEWLRLSRDGPGRQPACDHPEG